MSNLRKYWLSLLLIVYLPNLIFILYFAISPLSFYFREWEYFTDLGHKGYFPKIWQGEHHGDQSRKYFFNYQETRPITSSIDDYGFRAPFHKSESYPVVVIGDSFAYGSALDDTETFHWQLAEKLNTPIYNLVRAELGSGLNHPLLKNAKVIIEILNEKAMNASFTINEIEKRPFKRLRAEEGSWYETLSSVPSERYLFHSAVLRSISAIGKDIYTWIKNDYSFPQYLFDNFEYTTHDIEIAAQAIKSKSESLKKLGYDYYFISIPRKQAFYRSETSVFMKTYSTQVTQKLEALGVKTVDVTPHFNETLKSKALYIPADTHWAPAAVHATVEAFSVKYGLELKSHSVL